MPDPRDFLPQPPWEGPPIPKFLSKSNPREYTEEEVADIARIFYEETARASATIYIPTGPIYTLWGDLTQTQRDQTIKGLKLRIAREGLRGYIERKRSLVGNLLTNNIIRKLESRGYL